MYQYGAEGERGEIVIVDEQSDAYGQRLRPTVIRKDAPVKPADTNVNQRNNNVNAGVPVNRRPPALNYAPELRSNTSATMSTALYGNPSSLASDDENESDSENQSMISNSVGVNTNQLFNSRPLNSKASSSLNSNSVRHKKLD